MNFTPEQVALMLFFAFVAFIAGYTFGAHLK